MIEIILSFFAGLLASLNPCVLPLLPIVVLSSLNKSKLGMPLMIAGLTFTFIAFGLLVGQITKVIFIDVNGIARDVSAIIMVMFGLILIIPSFKNRFSLLSSGVGNFANAISNTLSLEKPINHFWLGALMGLVWTPCSGPLLGGAIGLINTTEEINGNVIWQTVKIMVPFSLGASVPLLVIALGGQAILRKFYSKIFATGAILNIVFGVVLVTFGILIFTNQIRNIEIMFLDLLPDWWVEFSTQF